MARWTVGTPPVHEGNSVVGEDVGRAGAVALVVAVHLCGWEATLQNTDGSIFTVMYSKITDLRLFHQEKYSHVLLNDKLMFPTCPALVYFDRE